MGYRIRTIDLTASGREIVRERQLGQAEITIGRAAENDIHLPDLAVEQRHVQVVPALGGQLRLQAMGKLGFDVDGRTTTDTQIDPAEGAELVLGSYRLSFSRAEDGETAITIRQVEEREEGKVDTLGGFALASVLPGKRPMAWAGLAVILLAFLAVPVWTHLTREAAKADYNEPGAVMMDASWRTGALSSVHHGLEDNCEACHTEPFVAVRDETCLTCHKDDATDHADRNKLDLASGAPRGGDALLWRVAHAFGKPGPGACTDCHTEHEGATRMEPTRQRWCADCHGTLDERVTNTRFENASDFGKPDGHPEFTALVYTAAGKFEREPVAVQGNPVHWDGLRFPHRLHLSKTNGVAQMAKGLGREGYGEPLQCNNCHRPTADGVGMLPVNMENDCETCHSLVYDRVGNTFRTLRHGDSDEMRADLLALDRTARRPIVRDRQRPGQFGPGGLYSANFVSVTSGSSLLANAMSRQGLCGACHIPNPGRGAFEVMPVRQESRYLTHGWFNHPLHTPELLGRKAECSSCHAAGTSDSASDLLLPRLEQCRECHVSETVSASRPKVPSGCAMCHSYHPRTGPAERPPRIALQ
jgi:hypothetical protein